MVDKDYLIQAERLARLGSWKWDVRENKMTWSDGLFRILGFTPNEIEPSIEAYLKSVHPEDRNRVRDIIDRIMRNPQHFTFEERVIRTDNQTRFLLAQGEATRDGNGEIEGMVGFFQDITEQRQLENELRLLTGRILTAQEEDRAWISRELYDDIGQALTAISINLVILESCLGPESEEQKQRISDSQTLLGETLEAVHRFALKLRPAMLDKLGLIPTLRSHVKSFSERTRIQTHFRCSPAIEGLSDEAKTVVYRVIQESLNNTAKHAHAGDVDIEVRELGRRIHLEIKDNGRGFSITPCIATQPETQLGIVGMRERARLVDGVFRIESELGKGTTIRVEIPLRK